MVQGQGMGHSFLWFSKRLFELWSNWKIHSSLSQALVLWVLWLFSRRRLYRVLRLARNPVRCCATRCPRPLSSPWEVLSLCIQIFLTLPHESTLDQWNASTTLSSPRQELKPVCLLRQGRMTHREWELNSRWWGIRLVVTFIKNISSFTLTAKLSIEVSKGTINNKYLLFHTIFTINRRAALKFTASLIKTFRRSNG